MSQVAAVCRKQWGVTPSICARLHAAAKPFLMLAMGLPLMCRTGPRSGHAAELVSGVVSEVWGLALAPAFLGLLAAFDLKVDAIRHQVDLRPA